MKAAVWYWRHHVLQVDIDEAEDAIAGVRVSSDMCAPEGVQYEDGTYNTWAADPIVQRQHAEEAERWEAEWEAQESKPPPPWWEVVAPFKDALTGKKPTVKVWSEPPPWVGDSRASANR
jgi:hypothetical protein